MIDEPAQVNKLTERKDMKEGFTPFPDKHHRDVSYDEVIKHIQDKKEFGKKSEPSQEQATWIMYGEYPSLPHAFVFATDEHFGSVFTDYDLMQEHQRIVEETPNMYFVKGGDFIDAFSPTKHPIAAGSDAIPPDEQMLAVLENLKHLDQRGKLGAVQIGNHDKWSEMAGYRFEQFLQELQCPVFSVGGNIDIVVGEQGEHYRVFFSHTHWGNSKINLTNASKRALQYTSPHADLALLGHTHGASAETFDIAGERRGAILGGTYKTEDKHGKFWGMGAAGAPGYTVILWPDQHHFEIVRDPEIAQQFILGQIALLENNEGPSYTKIR